MMTRSNTSAKIHWVYGPEIDYYNGEPRKCPLKELTKLVQDLPDVKYGDFVSNVNERPERNDGLYLFDGKQVVELATDPDEYGNLPVHYRVCELHPFSNEFIPVKYWHISETGDDKSHLQYLDDKKTEVIPYSRSIDHNKIVWFNHTPHMRELFKNVTCGPLPFENSKRALRKAVFTKCTVHSVPVYIILDFGSMIGEDGNIQEDETIISDLKPYRSVLRDALRQETPVFYCEQETYFLEDDMDKWQVYYSVPKNENILFLNAQELLSGRSRWRKGR